MRHIHVHRRDSPSWTCHRRGHVDHHHDHVGGNLELKKKTNCKILGANIDRKRIPEIDITIKNEETFKLGSSIFKVHETPGHTIGHIIYHFFEDKILFFLHPHAQDFVIFEDLQSP